MLDEDDQKDAGYFTESKGKLTRRFRKGLDDEVEIINSFPFYGTPGFLTLFLCFIN